MGKSTNLIGELFDSAVEASKVESEQYEVLKKEFEKKFIKTVFSWIKKHQMKGYIEEFKASAAERASEAKSICQGFLDDLDTSIEGKLSNKIQTEVGKELAKYDKIVDENA